MIILFYYSKIMQRVTVNSVMAKVLDCGLVVSEFDLDSGYYIHLLVNTLEKGMSTFILPALGWILSLVFF